jgi:hypothetical protein
MSIIKRRKTVDYLQLHNYPVQKDLEDLAAIGLTHLLKNAIINTLATGKGILDVNL